MVLQEEINDIADFIESIQEEMGYDVPICVDGLEQSGKSTFSSQLIRKIKKRKGMGEINLERDIAYRLLEATDKITKIKPLAPFSLDEMIRAGWKRDWYNPENKELVRIFNQIGYKKAIFLFNIPQFHSLDPYYRNDRTKIWVHIIGKEIDKDTKVPTLFHAVMLERDYNMLEPDPWHLTENIKMVRKMAKNQTLSIVDNVSKHLRRYTSMNIFRSYFVFEPLPPKIWKKYKEYSEKRKMEKEQMGQIDRNWVVRKVIFKNLHDHGWVCKCGRQNKLGYVAIQNLTIPENDTKPMLTYETVRRDIGSRKR